MLEEVGADYTVKTLEFGGGDMKGPEYLAINPMGKVPAIKHRDVVVTEVAAICAWLADRFPEKNLAPGLHAPERGGYYRWLFFLWRGGLLKWRAAPSLMIGGSIAATSRL